MYMRQQQRRQSNISRKLLQTAFAMISVGLSTSRLVSGFAFTQRGAAQRSVMLQNKIRQKMVLMDNPAMMSSSSSDDKDEVLDVCVVCGPSGVGKGTIINKFMEEMGGSDLFGFTVSHTTRAPREGEVDGMHYHFVKDIEEMKNSIREGDFLEHAEVHGNYYGTSWSSLRDVQKAGKRCLLDIDVQGVQNIKTLESEGFQPKYIFIAPPSMESLKTRLIGRGSESEETLARRTANAQREVDYGLEPGNFDAIVVNGDLDLACEDFARRIKMLFD